jgi:hypothetical protein
VKSPGGARGGAGVRRLVPLLAARGELVRAREVRWWWLGSRLVLYHGDAVAFEETR